MSEFGRTKARPGGWIASPRVVTSGALNPFQTACVRTPWDSPAPIDVPGINRGAGDEVLGLLELVRHSPERSRAVLVLGDEGVGKSHLIARLRVNLPGGALLAYAEPSRNPRRRYRDLLARLTGDLARADDNGLDQLTTLVSSAMAATNGERRWPAAHIAQLKRDEQLWRRRLNRTLLAVERAFPYADTDVLDHILRMPFDQAERRDLMWFWLSGSLLPVEQYYSLGLDSNIEDEDQAREVLRTIAALAAVAYTPLLLAIDRTEKVEDDPGNADSLAELVIDLEDAFPGLVIAMLARPSLWATEFEPALGDRFRGTTNRVVYLDTPGRAQAVALAKARGGIDGLGPLTVSDVESAWKTDARPGAMLRDLEQRWMRHAAHPAHHDRIPEDPDDAPIEVIDDATVITASPFFISPAHLSSDSQGTDQVSASRPDTSPYDPEATDDTIGLDGLALDELVPDRIPALEDFEELSDDDIELISDVDDAPPDDLNTDSSPSAAEGLLASANVQPIDLEDEFEEAPEPEQTVIMRIVAKFEEEEDLEEDRNPVFDPENLDNAVVAIDTSSSDAVVWAALDEKLEPMIQQAQEDGLDIDDSLPLVLLAIASIGREDTEEAATSGLPRNVLALVRHRDAPLLIVDGNHTKGTSFAYRTRWLVEKARAWRPQEPGFRAILLRDTDRKTPKRWKKSHEYLQTLLDEGGEFLHPTYEDLAVLEIVRLCLEQEITVHEDTTRAVLGAVRWPRLRASPLMQALLPLPD